MSCIKVAENRVEKICCKCMEAKPLSRFKKDRRKKDGRAYECAECSNADYRSRYWSSIGKVREQKARVSRRIYWENQEHQKARRSFYRQTHNEPSETERNPFKAKARIALREAVRRGKVHKPERCIGCGAKGSLHGHHEDYSRPLDVEWLCPKCHGARHRKYDAVLSARAQGKEPEQ